MVEIKAVDQLIAPFARDLPRSTSANHLFLYSLWKKKSSQYLPTNFLIDGFVMNGNWDIKNTGLELYFYQSWESRLHHKLVSKIHTSTS